MENMKICPKCKTKNFLNSKICKKCGYELDVDFEKSKKITKYTILFLILFFLMDIIFFYFYVNNHNHKTYSFYGNENINDVDNSFLDSFLIFMVILNIYPFLGMIFQIFIQRKKRKITKSNFKTLLILRLIFIISTSIIAFWFIQIFVLLAFFGSCGFN